ncbi:MAG TPA: universal stress protein [Methanocorpusculum sp.]|nr:universal stress protein [Methanocorpusculum sp.]
MFSKILVALDGSEISKIAFTRALDLAKSNGAELHAVYVIESGIATPGPVDTTWELIYQRFEKEGKSLMEDLNTEASEAGIKVIPHVETGHAGDTIVKLARELDCDLIVIGSLGKSKLDRLLLGSVSTHVVNYGKTNILIIRK